MQAIEVKETVDRNGNHYLVAFCETGKLKRLRDDVGHVLAQSSDWPNTKEARAHYMAKELAKSLGWEEHHYGTFVIGQLKNMNYVFVFTGRT